MRTWRRVLFVVGVLVFSAGSFGVIVSMVHTLGDTTAAAQRDLRLAYETRFSPPASVLVPGAPVSQPPHPVAVDVPVGEGLVVMRIPRLGDDWRWLALEGTADWVIAQGPGHYSWTPLPGARGNAAFAAHRAGHGDPFIDFDKLRPGDKVVLRQGHQRWVYTLTMRPAVIDVTDTWVLEPLGGRKLTLTTCWPKYGSSKRMYVRGRLVSASTS